LRVRVRNGWARIRCDGTVAVAVVVVAVVLVVVFVIVATTITVIATTNAARATTVSRRGEVSWDFRNKGASGHQVSCCEFALSEVFIRGGVLVG